MGDFVQETALERIGEAHFRATLSDAWRLWGPNGGYVASIALRAAGAVSPHSRAVSLACQYLSVARFGAIELGVESLRRGKRSEALRVTAVQDERTVLVAQVWTASENEGMVHDHVPVPELPPPECLKPLEALVDRPLHPFYANFEQRPIDFVPFDDSTPGEPEQRGFYRFRPCERSDDRYADAARAVILLDTFTWPATYRAHPAPGPSPWIAPNLDLYVRFHRDTRPHPWLYHVGRADLAEDGIIAAHGAVFSRAGKLLATGATQLFCSPRPAQYR